MGSRPWNGCRASLSIAAAFSRSAFSHWDPSSSWGFPILRGLWITRFGLFRGSSLFRKIFGRLRKTNFLTLLYRRLRSPPRVCSYVYIYIYIYIYICRCLWKSTHPDKKTGEQISFESTKSGAESQFPLLGRMAEARRKGKIFHRHWYDIDYTVSYTCFGTQLSILSTYRPPLPKAHRYVHMTYTQANTRAHNSHK